MFLVASNQELITWPITCRVSNASMAAEVIQSLKRREFCLMHVINNAKQKLTLFSYTSWCRFLSFTAKWKKFQCKEGEIAIKAAANLGLKFDDLPSGLMLDREEKRQNIRDEQTSKRGQYKTTV